MVAMHCAGAEALYWGERFWTIGESAAAGRSRHAGDSAAIAVHKRCSRKEGQADGSLAVIMKRFILANRLRF